MDHVIVRKLEHLTGSQHAPALSFAIETRDRPGPAYKAGAFPRDVVWIQLHGGLVVAKATVRLCWVGEYSAVQEIRARTRGSALSRVDAFWTGRPRYGYAAVASLASEMWVDPFWAGPRTYGYEWIVLDDDKKKRSWLERKEPPRTGEQLRKDFLAWQRTR